VFNFGMRAVILLLTGLHEKRKLLREMTGLTLIFLGLIILAIRPFGFRTFLSGLGHDNIFSLLVVTFAVAIILVMLQGTGLIFPGRSEREKRTVLNSTNLQ
jgi:hypothetical protein